MTPCEKLGYKVGDEFVVIEDHCNAKKGEKLVLLYDDGTSLPYFEKHTKGGDKRYFPHLKWVEKVTAGGETITHTNGQPFGTEASARQQLTAKGLQGTHEVVPHEGGYALVPIQRVGGPITLRSGDYVSTEGMTEEQYHAVAKAFENAGCPRLFPNDGKGPGEILEWYDDALFSCREPEDGGRLLTIHQVLNATNAGTITTHTEETTMTANPITTLKQARQARDEAEQAYQEALGEAREYLGEGFEILEKAASEETGEDIPAREWKTGDYVTCVEEHDDHVGEYTVGKTYRVWDGDGTRLPGIESDQGEERFAHGKCFRFHHRPK